MLTMLNYITYHADNIDGAYNSVFELEYEKTQ